MSKIVIAIVFAMQMALFAPAQASAQMLSTHEVVRSSKSLSQKLLAELDKQNVQSELKGWGINVEEAKLRIAGMSDEELQQIVNGNQPHAGGDVIVISLTTILLIVIIILLID